MRKNVLLMVLLCYTSDIIAKNRCGSAFGFIENKGQIISQNNQLNADVKFIGVCNGLKVQLKANSFSYEVLKVVSCNIRKKQNRFINDSTVINSHRIDVELINANSKPFIITEGKSVDYLNYYTTATPENGITDVHYYNKVSYKDIYPHIDLEFVTDASLKQPYKYNFIIHNGGDISDIQMHFNGANQTELRNGAIAIENSSRLINENIPASYIIESGRAITVKFTQLGKDIYGFSDAKYNNQNTLVIDPWATYYGGGGCRRS